jgi:hypothetical protein
VSERTLRSRANRFRLGYKLGGYATAIDTAVVIAAGMLSFLTVHLFAASGVRFPAPLAIVLLLVGPTASSHFTSTFVEVGRTFLLVRRYGCLSPRTGIRLARIRRVILTLKGQHITLELDDGSLMPLGGRRLLAKQSVARLVKTLEKETGLEHVEC